MAWQTELTELLRTLVLDFDKTKYPDDQLERVLAVAAFQVAQDLDFSQTYAVRIIPATILPDPTAVSTRDDAFINLTCIKGACIIDTGSAAIAASQGIFVKDNGAAIDLRGIVAGKLALLKQGWCKVYQDVKFEHQLGLSQVAGMAVMTPFRACAYFNQAN